MVTRKPFGSMPDGPPVEMLTLFRRRSRARRDHVRRHHRVADRTRHARRPGQCRPRIRPPRALFRLVSLLRRGRWAIRQPHPGRAVFDRRRGASRHAQRPAESSPWRAKGIRQAPVAGGSLGRRRRHSAAPERGWRRRVSRNRRRGSSLSARRARRSDGRIRGGRRCADTRQSHAAFIFQSARDWRRARARPFDQRERVSAGGRAPDTRAALRRSPALPSTFANLPRSASASATITSS